MPREHRTAAKELDVASDDPLLTIGVFAAPLALVAEGTPPLPPVARWIAGAAECAKNQSRRNDSTPSAKPSTSASPSGSERATKPRRA
jgi:hypothetical protein